MSLEQQVQKVMADLGLEYIQAYRHVQQQIWLQSQPSPVRYYE
jgi:hypothetical protein